MFLFVAMRGLRKSKSGVRLTMLNFNQEKFAWSAAGMADGGFEEKI
jgi:hypothetical protein